MSGGTSPPIPKSPKQSKLGNIGKKLIDGLKQMEISADSWQAPGEISGPQGTYVRERPKLQNAQLSRESMMLEVERAKRLQELQRIQQEDENWRKSQASRSPSERSTLSMQTHARQHEESAKRVTQELAELELRKRALQEQQEHTEQQWREQTELQDRQLRERMDALNRSPNLAPPQNHGTSPPVEEAYSQFYPNISPQIRTTGSRTPSSPRGTGPMPPTPMGKVDELYSRMSNEELKNLAAMSNVPSFDKIPLATPVLKPHDPHQHNYQHQRNYAQGSMRPNLGQQQSGPSTRPPWEKWQARPYPPYETMDDLRSRSAPLYRDQLRSSYGRAMSPRPTRLRASSDSSQSDPFGLGANGPFGHQGYGGTSAFDKNPFEENPTQSLDHLNPEDIFGTGSNSFDDEMWPPHNNGPSMSRSYGPYGVWQSGSASQMRSRTTSESSVPFGETLQRPTQPLHNPQRPRTNSMHPHRPPYSQGWSVQGEPVASQANSYSRMRSYSGPPRPDFGLGGPPRDQDWHQKRPAPPQDRDLHSRQHPDSLRNDWTALHGHHRISRDDIAQARARAEQIRREREEQEWRARGQQQPRRNAPYESYNQMPPSQHSGPQQQLHPGPMGLDGLSDQDLSYLATDPIVRDLVLLKLPPAEQRSVMDRLHRLGPVQFDGRQHGAPPAHQPYPMQPQVQRGLDQFAPEFKKVEMGEKSAAFPSMPHKESAMPGVRFEDENSKTPMASPRLPNTPFSAQTPLSVNDMPSHYPGKPPMFPAEPARSVEFRVHRHGASLDGYENMKVVQHLTAYPPPSTGPVPELDEIVTSQILELVTRAKQLGATALLHLQTRELPSGQYIVEGDAAK